MHNFKPLKELSVLDSWLKIVLVYLIGIFIFFMITLMVISLRVSHKTKLVVPALIGEIYFDLHNTLVNQGFKISIETTHLLEYPMGYILSQNIPAGESIKAGDKLILLVNQSQAMVKTPMLVGKFRSLVPEILSNIRSHKRHFSLKEGVVTFIYSEYPKGVILAQHPKAGTPVIPEHPISYLVSKGGQLSQIRFKEPSLTDQHIEMVKKISYFLKIPLSITIKETKIPEKNAIVLQSFFDKVPGDATWQSIQNTARCTISIGYYRNKISTNKQSTKTYLFSTQWIPAAKLNIPFNVPIMLARKKIHNRATFYEPEIFLILQENSKIPFFIDQYSELAIWNQWIALDIQPADNKVANPVPPPLFTIKLDNI